MAETTSKPRLVKKFARHTQKLNGLLTLKSLKRFKLSTLNVSAIYHNNRWYQRVTNGYDPKTQQAAYAWRRLEDDQIANCLPAFVRPCPERPRHGFVESRRVLKTEDLLTLAAETKKEDARGEVMLTPVYTSVQLNAIWTPSLLTLGEGHDGATAGKDTVTFPLVGPLPKDLQRILPRCGVGPDEDPYIEAIYTGGSSYARWMGSLSGTLTQLRAGPKGAVLGDYIPVDTTVSTVIKAGGDLLEWERLLRGATPGTVVYHPGGSPSDHYSAHARTFGVPVIFSAEPVVGSTLVATSTPTLDPGAVLEGIILGDQWLTLLNGVDHETGEGAEVLRTDLRQACTYMLAAFHHAGASGGVNASRIFGFSVITMIRLGFSAAMAEARYEKTSPIFDKFGWSKTDGAYRELVWDLTIPWSLSKIAANLNYLINKHRWGNFGNGCGSETNTFGGKKWAQCALSLIDLINGVRDLARERDSATLNTLIRAMNIAINQAHNGGWWLGKFVSQSTFNSMQKNDPLELGALVAPAWVLGKYLRDTPVNQAKAKIWARLPQVSWRSWLLSPKDKLIAKTTSNGSFYPRIAINTRLVSVQTWLNKPAIAALRAGEPITLTQDNDVMTVKVGDCTLNSTAPLTTQTVKKKEIAK